MLFKIAFDTLQNFHRIIDTGFIHIDFLEAAAERTILFKMLAVFFISGRTHCSQFSTLQRGLQQV